LKKLFIFIAVMLIVISNTKAQQYIEFVENKGQWDNDVKFVGNIKQGKFGLIKNGYIVNKWTGGDFHSHGKSNDDVSHKEVEKAHNWHVKFVDANSNVQIVPSKPLEFLSNYYIGNDKSKWAEGCKSYTEFTYKNMYDNIDVHYYTSNGTLKYDIIVHPGGDVSKIDILYQGVNKLSKNKNGNLSVETSIGSFEEMQPYTYQVNETGKLKISSSYQLSGNRVSFNLGNYDKSKTLIIDPTIIFSTHSGSTADNWGMTATYGPDETFFGGGFIQGGNGFNTGPGPVNGSSAGARDIIIMKLSANGSNRLFVTYIGGANDEQPASLVADNSNNLFFLGRTNSANFPSAQTLGTGGGYDIVVGKLNVNGTLNRALRIGGSSDDGVNIQTGSLTSPSSLFFNYGDDGRGEINLDQAGNVLVSTCTQSDNFYLLNASQSTKAGAQDVAVLKFNSALTSTIFSTFYGGSGNDAGYVISENKENGNLFVAGGTASNNLPGDKTGVINPTFGGGAAGTVAAVDGFITVFSPTGTVVRSTYLGTASHDQIYGLQFDKNNFPYVMGISLGSMPVVNALFSNPGSHQFVAKLKKDLSGFEFATKFGTNTPTSNISPVAFLVDVCENIYVSGWGSGFKANFRPSDNSVSSMPVTADAFKSSSPDGNDFYYIVIEESAKSMLFGSFFGGNDLSLGEHVDGGTSRFDPKGYIYQAACASCGNATGSNSYPIVNGIGTGGGNCNLGMTKIRFNYTGVVSELNVRDTTGCAPLTTTFEELYRNAVSYEYDFGDGSPIIATTNPIQSHTYTVPGTYFAKLIAINLSSCNLRDTAIQRITVKHPSAVLDFNGVKQPPCLNLTYQFNNLSVAPASRPFGANVFRWNFGDNTPTVTSSGLAPVQHTYAAAGTYIVKLILLDTAYCNYPDSIVKTFILSTTVIADFVPTNGCAPYTTTIQNTSAAGSSWLWDFGSAGTSVLQNPTVTFTNPGTYNVRLITTDLATCNLRDTITKQVIVHPSPVANFTFTPNPSQLNTPSAFNNLSTNATIYKWKFGDGDSSTVANPIHQFIRTGTFNTCLYASNQFGCRDTFCRDVPAIVEAIIDIPTAITPNGDGVNDFVIPRGFGIETITFRIFNRWGNLLFETNERNKGWDGKYNGAVQPKEVYSYTLDAVMVDGTKVKKSGNITLLR
jgi:gliding motility-associated-like protein